MKKAWNSSFDAKIQIKSNKKKGHFTHPFLPKTNYLTMKLKQSKLIENILIQQV